MNNNNKIQINIKENLLIFLQFGGRWSVIGFLMTLINFFPSTERITNLCNN